MRINKVEYVIDPSIAQFGFEQAAWLREVYDAEMEVRNVATQTRTVDLRYSFNLFQHKLGEFMIDHLLGSIGRDLVVGLGDGTNFEEEKGAFMQVVKAWCKEYGSIVSVIIILILTLSTVSRNIPSSSSQHSRATVEPCACQVHPAYRQPPRSRPSGDVRSTGIKKVGLERYRTRAISSGRALHRSNSSITAGLCFVRWGLRFLRNPG